MADTKPDKRNIEDISSLTAMQEAMLFHYLRYPQGDLYFEQLALHVSGPVDRDIFGRAWNLVVGANPMLRTIFRWEKLEVPVQVTLRHCPAQIRCRDLSAQAPAERRRGLEQVKEADRREKFDLRDVAFRITLVKLAADEYEILCSSHHILYDGWSNGIILEEFLGSYNRLCGGLEPHLPQKERFSTFVARLKRMEMNRHRHFWTGYLGEVDPPAALSSLARPAAAGAGMGLVDDPLDPRLEQRLHTFVEHRKLTPAALLYGAWAILLHKYTDSLDPVFGTIVAGRSVPIKGIEQIVGLFVNIIPLRVMLSPGATLLDLVLRVGREAGARQEFEHTPLLKIKEFCGLAAGTPLFDTVVGIENYPLERVQRQEGGAFRIDSYSVFAVADFDLVVSLKIVGGLALILRYNRAHFDRPFIEAVSCRLMGIISRILEEPDIEVAALDLLGLPGRAGEAAAKKERVHRPLEAAFDFGE
jgi:hypothetical protein